MLKRTAGRLPSDELYKIRSFIHGKTERSNCFNNKKTMPPKEDAALNGERQFSPSAERGVLRP